MPETSNGGFRISYAESSLTFKFELITAILNLERLKVSKNATFLQLVPEASNAAFCVSYAQSSLTLKFELNTAILDFDRFEVGKNPIFYNSCWRPRMVRFLLVTLRAP